MGLVAIVSKRLDELAIPEDKLPYVSVDPTTGLIDFDDREVYATWNDESRAVEKHIGSGSTVSLLKRELEKVVPERFAETVILQRFLHASLHSGDCVPLVEIPQLKREALDLLGRTPNDYSDQFRWFLEDVLDLANAAEIHRTPIAFL